ncbi:glycosyltransferase [Natronomonas sp. EA1]|uniref:glycosyltransferase n=1 Tax=Natronomonas sp. EA1 TaxID=3421655 RepID=UPI003EBAEF12
MTDRGDDRITVWYLIGRLSVGGTERTLVDLVNGLDQERFAPVVWTITEPGPLAADLDDDIPLRSLGAASKVDPRPPLRLARALRRDRPTLLQSFLYFDNVLARLVGTISPETTVVTGVREVPDAIPRHRSIVDRVTLPLSDHIVSNSKAGAEWIIRRGADPASVSVVKNGRDIDAYDVNAPAGLAEALGIDSGPVVGTVGRLVERKGHHDLLDAWPAVLKDHPHASLVIVGEGPERAALEAHAERLGISDSVHLLGRRGDVPELLDLFDVFVFPSHYEGLPGALIEAMAAGLPIVTTPVDGCAELIMDGEHGLHVPVRDSDRLAGTLIEILEDPGRAEQLAAAAQRRAREQFTIGAMVENTEALYGRLTDIE